MAIGSDQPCVQLEVFQAAPGTWVWAGVTLATHRDVLSEAQTFASAELALAAARRSLSGYVIAREHVDAAFDADALRARQRAR